jgi:protein AFG1
MMHTAARGEDPLPAIIDQLASEAWLLCVDEFQVTDIADAMLLRRLLGGLIGKGMVLVTTSNRHPDELYKNGIQRQSFVPCIDLIKQHCDVYCLDAAGAGAVGNERPLRVDYRKLAVATAATALPTETSGKTTSSSSRFIYPLGPQTEQTIDGIFKALCRSELGGTTATSHLTTPTTTAAPTERILTVMGRPLRVPMQCGSTVARFTFQELCGQAMSAADYLELCANYQALILTGIPRMSVYANRNELRRFITLIDALYEHRVRLYCTADAAAAQLLLTDTTSTAVNAQPTASTRSDDIAAGEETYDEEFAFSRTVSRLTQMARGKWPSNFT